jgi:hypothetical protein
MWPRRAPTSRREALRFLALGALAAGTRPARAAAGGLSPAARPPSLREPIWVYDNWSSYDELSDTVKLTEALAMHQLDELVRIRTAGARIDYYLMDAFWFAPDGGYRVWREEEWPHGPERWLAALRAHGITPGLWFGGNTLTQLEPAPEWRSSLTRSGHYMAFYAGDFLSDFMDVLQHWYERGVRLFKIDFVELGAALDGDEMRLSPEEIRTRNADALRTALAEFRRRNADAILVGFNGFGGDLGSTAAPFPFENPVDPEWLDVFDALFPGDPRPADVPHMDFWRAMDIYTDHVVRRVEESGVPLGRIDSTGFMIGDTGTNFRRRTGAWRGMMLLLVARGGWIHTLYGNLDFLDDNDASWLAAVQRFFEPLQRTGETRSFGAIPGNVEPYGFVSANESGALYTVMNPAQRVTSLRLPRAGAKNLTPLPLRVLFHDSGYTPVLENRNVRLGPGQLALVGAGNYADASFDLGIDGDIRIPHLIEPVEAAFAAEEARTIEAVVAPPESGDLRIVLQQRDRRGLVLRSYSRGSMGEFFVIRAEQEGAGLPVEIRYDKRIWSGLSWAVGEIRGRDITPGKPIRLRLSSAEKREPIVLDGRVYRVEYR